MQLVPLHDGAAKARAAAEGAGAPVRGQEGGQEERTGGDVPQELTRRTESVCVRRSAGRSELRELGGTNMIKI